MSNAETPLDVLVNTSDKNENHNFSHNRRDKQKHSNWWGNWENNYWSSKKWWFSPFKILFIISIFLNLYFFIMNTFFWIDYQVKKLYEKNQKTYTTLQSIQSVLDWSWLLVPKK